MAVGIKDTPILLNVVDTRSVWLPGLIESLEDTNIDTPVSHGTDSLLPVLLGVVKAWVSVLEVGTVCWPAGLTNPEVEVGGTLDGLDGLQSLHDVIEERVRSVVHLLTLPVRESVGVNEVSGLDGSGRSTVNQDVPRVDSSNRDVTVGVTVLVLDRLQESLDGVDSVGQVAGSHVLSVQSLGTHKENLDGVLGDVWQVLLQSVLLILEVSGVSWPNAKHNLKAGSLGSRTQILQGVTVRDSVSLDNAGVARQCLEVAGILGSNLTVTLVVLNTQVETELAS